MIVPLRTTVYVSVLYSTLLGMTQLVDRQPSAAHRLAQFARVERGPRREPRLQGRNSQLYYGVSSQGWAWLFRLDFERGDGALYDPVNAIRLCDVVSDSTGAISWTSVPVLEIVRTFKGRTTRGGLSGTLEFNNIRTLTRRTIEITLDSIPSLDSMVSGIYSSRAYNEHAGDLLGEEVLLLTSQQRVWAAITKYEGTPQGPFALSNIEWKNDSLSGVYGTPVPMRALKIVLRSDTLQLSDGTMLPKRHDLSTLLTPGPSHHCGK
jgi:hypothetical protein